MIIKKAAALCRARKYACIMSSRGERCDCTKNRNGDNSPKENKSCEGANNNDRD